MSEKPPDGPIPGASQRTDIVLRHWEAELAHLDSWFIERRIQPDANLFLNDLLHYVTALFDTCAAHKCLIWVNTYSDIDAEYIPTLRRSSDKYLEIAQAYAKRRVEGPELDAFLLAVRTRLDSRILLWKAEALRDLALGEAKSMGRNLAGTPPNADDPRGIGLQTSGNATPRAKTGPTPDKATASRVADIVNKLANGGRWKDRLAEICAALDEAEIPFPKKWCHREPKLSSWSDAADWEPALARHAITYRLKIADS